MISFFQRNNSQTHTIQSDGFEVTIVRTDRKKSATIKVKDGVVSITTPKRAALTDIESMIAKKSNWIKKQLLRQNDAKEQLNRSYNEGEKLFYRGEQLTLIFQNNQKEIAIIKGEQLLLSANIERSPENIRTIISDHFKKLAEKILIEKTELYAGRIGVGYKAIRVKSYKSRWGSCSTKGVISYNWRIIIAPDPVLDYIIIHELCHLIEHNHSPRFWALVEQFSPCYKQDRNWLCENGLLLDI